MKTNVLALFFALHFSAIAACRRLNTFTSSLEVVPDFLLEHSSNNNGDTGYSITDKVAPFPDDAGRFRGKAHLSHSMVRAIWEIISEPGPEEPINLKQETIVNTVIMDKTTEEHTDYYDDPVGKRRLVEHDERVAFVFLNTNPDAIFIHNKVKVPVVEGHLVHFNGALPHNTIIKSGSVRLLGPFYSADLSTSVGSTTESPAPTTSASPSTSPSTAPSESHSPSIAPSKKSSDAPSTAPNESASPSAMHSPTTDSPVPKRSKSGKKTGGITKSGKSGGGLGESFSLFDSKSNGMSLPYDASMSF
jgi:hypothetical protein